MAPHASHRHTTVAERIRAEFNELPGLRLTRAQVRRLCSVDLRTCEQVLADLEREGFLSCDNQGQFARPTSSRRSA